MEKDHRNTWFTYLHGDFLEKQTHITMVNVYRTMEKNNVLIGKSTIKKYKYAMFNSKLLVITRGYLGF